MRGCAWWIDRCCTSCRYRTILYPHNNSKEYIVIALRYLLLISCLSLKSLLPVISSAAAVVNIQHRLLKTRHLQSLPRTHCTATSCSKEEEEEEEDDDDEAFFRFGNCNCSCFDINSRLPIPQSSIIQRCHRSMLMTVVLCLLGYVVLMC